MVQRSRAASALDWLALALVVLAAVIALTGGLSVRLGGQRLTARSPDRAVFAALAVVALRVALDRRTRPSCRHPPLARTVRDRVYVPLQDPVVPIGRSAAMAVSLLALAGFTVFAAVLLFPQLQRMDSVPDLGDPLFSIWRFGWVFHKLGGDPRPLFSPNVFYPHPLTLTYSDSMLLPALTTAPFLAVGMHPVVAYNLVHGSELHRVGVRDVPAGRAPDRLARRRRSSPACCSGSIPTVSSTTATSSCR